MKLLLVLLVLTITGAFGVAHEDSQIQNAEPRRLRAAQDRNPATFASLLAKIQKTSSAPKSAVPKKVTLDEINGIEKSIVSLISKGPITEDIVSFVDSVFNITVEQLKPAVLAQLSLIQRELNSSYAQVQECAGSLGCALSDVQTQFDNVVRSKVKLQQCVWSSLANAGLAGSSTRLQDIDWDYVSFQLNQKGLGMNNLASYISGDFAGSNSQKCLSDAARAVTEYTCKEKDRRCRDYKDFNGLNEFVSCASNSPEFVSSSVNSSCKDSRGRACCKNPDALTCNSVHQYGTAGDYYQSMYDYWDAMIKDWEASYKECSTWCSYCSGNLTECPDARVNHVCPASPDHRLNAASNQGPSMVVHHACEPIQVEMDSQACQATQQSIASCTEYDCCFNRTRASLNEKRKNICDKGGDVTVLQHEWYGVLRVECLLTALKLPSEVMKKAAVDVCTRKTVKDYDLSIIAVKACEFGEAKYEAATHPHCKGAMNLTNYENISGTPAYRAKYYEGLSRSKPCISQCCVSPPLPWKPLASNLK
eukprot:TRINITY_DN40052_c0_g1_i1.p1 TRINITY_DN40052_c0_g1~~TRINITY_DN40052_c0_g1_i1.p1  ORF type:complete len:534 (+),score=81.84 TRINITY_DN40052_c0_g1_i1:83-1684(+)